MIKRLQVMIVVIAVSIAAIMPCNAYAADAEDWASLEGWLSSINGKLGYIYADTTNIYTALSVVKDTVTTISTNVTNIKSSVDDMTDDLAYLPAISSTVTNINTYTSGIYTRLANLSTIKDIVDSHTTLLTTINNNINNVWADVQLIKDTTGYINSAVSTINTNISNLNTNVVTIGETMDNIYTDIHSMSQNIGNIYTLLNSIKQSYTYPNGSTYNSFRVYPISAAGVDANQYLASYTGRIFTINDNVATIKTTLNTISSNITAQTTSIVNAISNQSTTITDEISSQTSSITSAISTQTTTFTNNMITLNTSIQNVNTTLTNIYNLLNSMKYISEYPNGNTYTSLKVYPISGANVDANQYLASYTGRIFTINDNVASIKTTLEAMSSNVTSQTTSIVEAVSSQTSSITSAITTQTTTFTNNMITLNSSIQSVNTTLTNIYNLLNSVKQTYEYPNGVSWNSLRVYPVSAAGVDDNQYLASYTGRIFQMADDLASMVTSVQSIESVINANLSNIASSISNIYDLLLSVRQSYTYPSGASYYFLRVFPVSSAGIDANQYLVSYTGRVFAIADKAAEIQQTLEDLYDVCYAILQKQSIPSNSETIIGDFDDELFDSNVNDLVANISTLAPFGAVSLLSSELNVLTQVAAIDNPELVIPFNFGGFDNSVILDLTWLDDLKPMINFFFMLMLMLGLTTISMRYVRGEATS